MIHFFLRKEGGSTSHPSRDGLDTCLFFWERGEWFLIRFDSGREVVVGVGGVFVWGGVFVLFVLLFFFVWGLLDTCPFLRSLWIHWSVSWVDCGP